MRFFALRDYTGDEQIANERRDDDLDRAISNLTANPAVEVEGRVIRNDTVKLGKTEIISERIIVHGLTNA